MTFTLQEKGTKLVKNPSGNHLQLTYHIFLTTLSHYWYSSNHSLSCNTITVTGKMSLQVFFYPPETNKRKRFSFYLVK
uniref:Uncharacterized protein n=1 Tax=Rhizophora mucronata TaxID=61149 RepID=A0A2P2JUG9_RHIMU